MKKLFILLCSVAALQSCQSDDSGTPQAQGPLLQSMVQTVDGESTTTTYSYNGNKLSSINMQGGDKMFYTYSGNRITSR